MPPPGPSPQGDVIPPPPDLGAAPQPPAAHPSASTRALCHHFMSPFPGSASRVSHDRRWSCLCSCPPSALGCATSNSERTWAEGSLQQQPLLLAPLFSILLMSLQPQHLAVLSYMRHRTVSGNRNFCYVEEKKKFFSLNYLCHRLLEQFWMHPLPLKASSPKLLVLAVSYE